MYAYAGNNPVRYIDPTGKDIVNHTNGYIIVRLENPIELSNGKKVDTVVLAPNDKYVGKIDGSRDQDGNYTKVSAQDNQTINYSVEQGNRIKFIDKESKNTNIKNDLIKALNNIFPFAFGWKIYSGSYEKGDLPAKYLSDEWDKRFITDLGKDGFKKYESAYNSEIQKLFRKECFGGSDK